MRIIAGQRRGHKIDGPRASARTRPISDMVRESLFNTDGLTWRERQSDLRQIVEFQNNGDITRILQTLVSLGQARALEDGGYVRT